MQFFYGVWVLQFGIMIAQSKAFYKLYSNKFYFVCTAYPRNCGRVAEVAEICWKSAVNYDIMVIGKSGRIALVDVVWRIADYVQKRVHADRAPCGNRHYRVIDIDNDAGTGGCKEAGAVGDLSVESAALGGCLEDVYG